MNYSALNKDIDRPDISVVRSYILHIVDQWIYKFDYNKTVIEINLHP